MKPPERAAELLKLDKKTYSIVNNLITIPALRALISNQYLPASAFREIADFLDQHKVSIRFGVHWAQHTDDDTEIEHEFGKVANDETFKRLQEEAYARAEAEQRTRDLKELTNLVSKYPLEALEFLK